MARICMIAFTRYAPDARVRREAEALVARGDSVDVVSIAEGSGRTDVRNGVRVHGVWKSKYAGKSNVAYVLQYFGFLFCAAAFVTRLHLRRRCDVIYVHTMPDFLVFAAGIPRLLGAKVILDVHDLTPELYASKFGHSEAHRLIRLLTWVERRSVAFAHRAIAVHDVHLAALVRHGNPRDKFTVVMNTADPEIFPRLPRSTQTSNRFRLIYHGTVSPRHGLDVAVRAVAEARQKIEDLEFLVLGEGDDLDRIDQLVSELDLRGTVVVRRGFVPIEELTPVLSQADVGIVPIHDDPFTKYMLPVKLLEYAALGIPAICSSTETIRAYFDDTMVRFVRAGDPRDLAAAIVELHRDPARRDALAAGARRFNDQHGWEAEKAKYYELIDSLADRPGGVAASRPPGRR